MGVLDGSASAKLTLLWNRHLLLTVFLLTQIVAQAGDGQTTARGGRIQFSNGETKEGRISLTPGATLRIHTDTGLRTVTLDRVQEIRLFPEREELTQKWRFPEAGQTRKEKEGAPYPFRQLRATILLVGQQKITGHLYTTVLYVEGNEKTEKVVLWAQQRGKEGETLESLVFPSRITFSDTAANSEDTIQLKIQLADLATETEVVALTRGSLVRLEATRRERVGEYQLPSPLGQELFLGVKTGGQIMVGWPNEKDEPMLGLIGKAVSDLEDFFDDRKLLATFRDPANADVYSLLLATRRGATTLAEKQSQPWRLVLLRWKYDDESRRLMLAGRGFLFRGILSQNESPPTVSLSEKLWRLRKEGNIWTAGDD